MNSQPPDMKAAFLEISRHSRADGRGRIFAVISAAKLCGSSFVARQLALTAVQNGFQCSLIDMGLTQNSQYEAFSAPEMQAHYGALEGPYDASFGVQPFWHVSPVIENDQAAHMAQAPYMALFTVGQTGLVVSKFMWEQLSAGQTVHLAHARYYWHALRDNYPLSFVDLPSSDQSDAGENVFAEMDGVIITMPRINDPASSELLSRISHLGGKCVGAVLNSHRAESMPRDSA